VDEISRAHGYSPAFILSVVKNESTFQVGAVSPKGAVGLMQLLPATARAVAAEEGIALEGQSLFDPALNLRLGFAYLRSLEDRYGSVDAALVVYNAGPQALKRGGRDGLPRKAYRRDIQETQRAYALWLKSP
jgi:soluble lytic murein transglycosylase-like protein